MVFWFKGWSPGLGRQTGRNLLELHGRRHNPGEAATSKASESGCLVTRTLLGYPDDILDGMTEGDLKHGIQMHNLQTLRGDSKTDREVSKLLEEGKSQG